MTRLFVTATGTDLGKTYVTAALCRAARRRGVSVRAIKPVASGFDPLDPAGSDPFILAEAQGLDGSRDALDTVSPWRFRPALSPDMAARREGRDVSFEAITDFCRTSFEGPEDLVLVEGVGGIRAPVSAGRTNRDLIAALNIPAILVAGSYLGTISHTLTALDSANQAGVTILALVLSQSIDEPVETAETAAVLAGFAPTLPIIPLTRRMPGDAARGDEDAVFARLRGIVPAMPQELSQNSKI